MQSIAVLGRPTDRPVTEPAAEPLAALVRLDAARTRRQPQLMVLADGSADSTRQLVWALREAARREALVVAVAVVDDHADEQERTATRTLVQAQLQHAIDRTGVQERSCTAVVDRVVFDAITGATCGGDLIVVRPHSKTILRPAMPRPPRRALHRSA